MRNFLYIRLNESGAGVWRSFKWTPWSLSGKLGKFERIHHPTPLSVMYKVGLTTKKHIPTPIFVTFIAFHCILSVFYLNFVTLYQVWSPTYQFDPILMMSPKKNRRKHNYEHDNYENGKWGIILGIPKNFQFLSWNWVNFWKYFSFSASFDHLVLIIQKHPPT